MGLRDFLARKTAQHVDVHTLDDAFVTELVETHTARRSVETYTINPEASVTVHTMDLNDGKKPEVRGWKITQESISTRGFKVKQYTKHDVKVRAITRRRPPAIFKATKKIQAMPIELDNKLKFQKNRPKVPANEVILAWYWPIVDNAVIKLALNKQRGTLLVWYNPGSRHGKAKGLYLIRKLGLGGKPEWRWV